MKPTSNDKPAVKSGIFNLGGDLPVYRLGFGSMQLTGKGVWGEPADRKEAIAVLRRAVELGITLIDTADSYGPHVAERLIAEALHPYPQDLVSPRKQASSGPVPANGWRMGVQRTSGRPVKEVSAG